MASEADAAIEAGRVDYFRHQSAPEQMQHPRTLLPRRTRTASTTSRTDEVKIKTSRPLGRLARVDAAPTTQVAHLQGPRARANRR